MIVPLKLVDAQLISARAIAGNETGAYMKMVGGFPREMIDIMSIILNLVQRMRGTTFFLVVVEESRPDSQP